MTARTLAIVVAVLAAYKALEHAVVFGAAAWPVIGAPLVLGAVTVFLGYRRHGAALIAVAALVSNLTPAYRNHLNLLMWVALTLAIFDDEEQQRFVLRCQLSILYGFAAIAKVWPDWLSGEAFIARTWTGPLLPEPLVLTVVWVTILIEALLAVTVWRRWGGWFALALVTHVAFVVFIHNELIDVLRLVVFSTLTISVWVRATTPARNLLSGRTAAPTTRHGQPI